MEAEVAVAMPFSRIGGAAAIDRLVEAFYARMDTLPQAKPIRSPHAADLTPVKEVLKRYLGECAAFLLSRSLGKNHLPNVDVAG